MHARRSPILAFASALSMLAAGGGGAAVSTANAKAAESSNVQRAETYCSWRRPFCVIADPGVSWKVANGVFDDAEWAWSVLTEGLELPPPALSISGPLLLHVRHAPYAPATAVVRERAVESPIDRAAAVVLLTDGAPDATIVRSETTRGLAEAMLLGAAPATDTASVRAEASYLVEIATGAPPSSFDDAPLFQSYSERSLTDVWPEAPDTGVRYDEESSVFYRWLDDAYGTTAGGVLRGLWALGATTTPAGAADWVSHPNGFDVLDASFRDELGTGSALDDLMVEFAIARLHPRVGEGGGVRLSVRAEIDIPWPNVARRFQSVHPVAPWGASYLAVHRGGADVGEGLRIEVEWEEHARMRWWVVTLGADASMLGRMPIAALDRATAAQLSVTELRGVDTVVVVGVNLGDPFAKFEPRAPVSEPHGWLVTVGRRH